MSGEVSFLKQIPLLHLEAFLQVWFWLLRDENSFCKCAQDAKLFFEAFSRVWVQNNLLFVVLPFVAGLLSIYHHHWEKSLKWLNPPPQMFVQQQKCRHWKQKNSDGVKSQLNILHHRLWKSKFGYIKCQEGNIQIYTRGIGANQIFWESGIKYLGFWYFSTALCATWKGQLVF